ncbi:hypothetical protein [Rhizohabitans arisaemae]|nr:hypothetical protein [Rhizohabitans arisaemae]
MVIAASAVDVFHTVWLARTAHELAGSAADTDVRPAVGHPMRRPLAEAEG